LDAVAGVSRIRSGDHDHDMTTVVDPVAVMSIRTAPRDRD